MADSNNVLGTPTEKRKTSDQVSTESASKHLKQQDDGVGTRSHPNTDPELLNMLPKLPRFVRIGAFARQRARELADLTASVELPQGGGGKRVFQQLPRHMRRRAMSRNVKRVPRWLREQHKKEVDKVDPSKRPSRRHRRRPRELLTEYNRRQRNFVWLETHIWHAKRFKMAEQWGYKIPVHPCDKSIRASYRAASSACLLQDLSYYCCFQLSGAESEILAILEGMSSQETGSTFAALASLDGGREGSTVLYQRNSYPAGAIAPVSFLWRPEAPETPTTNRRLWIWVHPTASDHLLSALTEAFGMTEQNRDGHPEPTPADDVEPTEKRRKKKSKMAPSLDESRDMTKLAPKLAAGTPTYGNGSVTLTVLKDTLVRFRLLGQMSTAVLAAVLQVDAAERAALDGNGGDVWWRSWEVETQEEQARVWDQLRATPHSSLVAPRTVIGLVVSDPRVNLSIDRRKFHVELPAISSENADLVMPPLRVSDSPLWDEGVRDTVTRSKTSDSDINALRAEALVPGTRLDLGEKGCRIPLLLVQQPGADSAQDLGHGWDLILPAGFAMAFWIPLIYHCARVGGCQEQLALARESQVPHFPDDYPDTPAGILHEEQRQKQLIEEFFRYPPNKRPNFVKLAIAEPFTFPWQRLTQEWIATLPHTTESSSNNAVFVLRDRKVLRRLQQAHWGQLPGARRRAGGGGGDLSDLLAGDCKWQNSLVCLRLRLVGRGLLSEHATVCLPTKEDLSLKQDHAGPVEPVHPDTKRAARDAQRMRRKSGKPANALEQEVAAAMKRPAEVDFRELYAPDYEQLIHSADRTLIGYAKGGIFSMRRGHVIGLAFVSFVGLVHLLGNGSPGAGHEAQVLVRVAHSSQYRLAKFSIP